jgi:ectoine hydroxylase
MGGSRRTERIRHAFGRLRPVVVASHLGRRRELSAAARSYRTLGMRKSRYATVRHAEVAGRGSGTPRLDRPDGLEELQADPAFATLPETLRAGLLAWPENGYLIAEGFFDRETLDAVNSDVDRLAAEGLIQKHRFRNIHRRSAAAASVAQDPRLFELLRLILGRPAELLQTISFIRGSQQDAHSDAFHMMTEPPGFLVGAWIALEDIDDGSGPVFYLPGSHRLPYVMSEDLDLPGSSPLLVPEKSRAYVSKMSAVAAEAGIEPRRFTPGAGDLLLWHHNLLHGGSAIDRVGSTRRSLVGHYFAEGVLCYHEVTERPVLLPAA